jgi:hypothetical protein
MGNNKLKDAEPADYPKELRVKVYNPEADELKLKLGLTDQVRLNRIFMSAHKFFDEEPTQVDALVKISQMCESANELTYLMFVLGDQYCLENN